MNNAQYMGQAMVLAGVVGLFAPRIGFLIALIFGAMLLVP